MANHIPAHNRKKRRNTQNGHGQTQLKAITTGVVTVTCKCVPLRRHYRSGNLCDKMHRGIGVRNRYLLV